MSTLSDYLNENLPAGWQKPQLVEALSGVLDRATVYRYLAGSHPRSPAEAVLEAFAAVLPGVTVVELRAAANLSTGVEEPWVPPIEANRLSYAQRRALEAFIKATVCPIDEVGAEVRAPGLTPPGLTPPGLPAPGQSGDTALTVQERAEVESYINQLHVSGRSDLADRLSASLATSLPVGTASRPADA